MESDNSVTSDGDDMPINNIKIGILDADDPKPSEEKAQETSDDSKSKPKSKNSKLDFKNIPKSVSPYTSRNFYSFKQNSSRNGNLPSHRSGTAKNNGSKSKNKLVNGENGI